ncbi:FkbM family methyltransferase [Romboutsia sedimentorum]|uniref:FkbM family methyltransferase n=1 Tax=Romboutsia sedimentorum TaxID=1368474 RepID=UPI0024DE0128|nr:FkbM family methyltransferase [Romboutsia sedimentorum]MDK2585831.1 FkbM family methyltransferase [Romboutsia sedimentorum]
MNIIIFGANENCIKLVNKEIDLDKHNIVCFLDNDNKLHGKKILDVPIYSPDIVNKYDYDYILIVSTILHHNSIVRQLLEIGVEEDRIIKNYGSGLYEKTRLFEGSLLCKAWLDFIHERIESKDIHKLIESKIKKTWCYEILEKVDLYLDRAKSYRAVLNDIENKIKNNDIVELANIKLDRDVIESKKELFYIEFLDIIGPELPEFEKELIIEGPYEYGNVIINEGDVVVDCGANLGLFSAVAANKIEKAKVYSFEPVSETYSLLDKMSRFYDNIIPVRKALSNKEGFINIDITGYDDNIGTPTIVESIQERNKKPNISMSYEKIETISLDKFVKDNNINKIDFIKADIEGAERLMLKGATEVLKKFAPKLSICTYHLEDDPEILEKIILEANPNYKIEHQWLKLYAYVPEV